MRKILFALTVLGSLNSKAFDFGGLIAKHHILAKGLAGAMKSTVGDDFGLGDAAERAHQEREGHSQNREEPRREEKHGHSKGELKMSKKGSKHHKERKEVEKSEDAAKSMKQDAHAINWHANLYKIMVDIDASIAAGSAKKDVCPNVSQIKEEGAVAFVKLVCGAKAKKANSLVETVITSLKKLKPRQQKTIISSMKAIHVWKGISESNLKKLIEEADKI